MKRILRTKAKIKILIGIEEMIKTLENSLNKNIFKSFKGNNIYMKNNIYKNGKKNFYDIYKF